MTSPPVSEGAVSQRGASKRGSSQRAASNAASRKGHRLRGGTSDIVVPDGEDANITGFFTLPYDFR